MSFAGNPLPPFLKRKNVVGTVDMPPTSCLRAASLSAYPTARVERTGRLRKRSSQRIGLAGQRIENHSICHVEGSDES